LQELVVERSLASLLGLLLLLTSGHLSLSGGNLCRLVLKAKVGGVHAASLLNASGLGGIAKDALANTRRRLRALKPLRKLLIAKPLNGLTLTDILCIQVLADLTQLRASTKVLRVALLTQCAKLRASAKGLSILLLTKSGKASANAELLGVLLLTKRRRLLSRSLLGRTVCLSSTETNALLLLGSCLSLPIARLKQVSHCRLIGKALLASQIGLLDTGTVAAKRT
jgi:hypothetical protein